MRQAGISGLRPKKRGRTTIRVPGVRVCEDLVDRAFLAAAPNRLWVADITYLRTWEGWLYLVCRLLLEKKKINITLCFWCRVMPRRVWRRRTACSQTLP